MSFLEHLRDKPRHVKGQYAFAAAFSSTLIIALAWGLSLPARFSNAPVADQTEPAPQEESTGLVDLVGSARAQLGSILNSTGEAERQNGEGGVIEEIPEVAPGMEVAQPETTSKTVLIGVTESDETPEVSTAADITETTPEPTSMPRVILIGTTTDGGGENESRDTE